jgi:hypothetical protein
MVETGLKGSKWVKFYRKRLHFKGVKVEKEVKSGLKGWIWAGK